jgi:putative ABC transport system permease protein
MSGADGRPLVATALRAVITPGYAEALGMRLKEGRFFRASDTTSAIRPMLVNATFARTYFRDGRPVTGRRFIGMFPGWLGKGAVVEIVGVVDDVLSDSLDGRPLPQVFVAHGRAAVTGSATFVVKTDGDPRLTAALLHDVVRQLEPGATLERVGPLTAKLSASVGDRRVATFVLVSFAGLALALATTGLYGVLSYHVARRRKEIGVRSALGATRRDLVVMVLREGLSITLMGMALGIVAAAVTARSMAGLLFGITPLDSASFTISALVLLVAACAACLIPARRAAAVDPAVALRAE